MAGTTRLLVLGWDSVSPDLLFRRFLPVMPNLRALLERGSYGPLRSCEPPITIPAWAVMFTGVDPGSLGLYGFRNRRAGSYFDQITPTPQTLPYPPVWELLSRAGRRVLVVGMPPGYPPPRVNGVAISDILTPDGALDSVWPGSVRSEVEAASGGYRFDVEFRTDRREALAEALFEMTRARGRAVRHLLAKGPWELAAVHEIGPDRLHHAFWKFFDPAHPRHVDHPDFRTIAERYYRLLDEELGRTLETVGPETTLLIVSDHGSQAMKGCFCINEWLASKGYLAFRRPPARPGVRLDEAEIDWSRTSAWGAGGYYARISFNVAGREPEGIVAPSKVEELAERMTRELAELHQPDGRPLGAEVRRPRSVYQEVRGAAPDLMVYFDGLRLRSAGTVGHGRLFLEENDTGPDDAVHDWDGVLVAAGPTLLARGALPTTSIRAIAPTILDLLGAPVPSTMQSASVAPVLRRPPSSGS